MTPRHLPGKARGAALLMAMIIVALVATLASAMVWQQWRSVQIETAERARAQSSWILTGALDWSQLILREDARADFNKTQGPNAKQPYDGLDEPWATPLAEARLSTFLAANENYTGDGPEAFLSGEIADAQARFNLMNLIDLTADPPVRIPAQVDVLKRLCNSLEVLETTADRIVQGMLDSQLEGRPGAPANPPIRPARVDQLSWFGIDPATLKRLEPYLVMIDPTGFEQLPTKINANTASEEVIAAVLGVNRGDAVALVQARKNNALRDGGDITKVVTPPPATQANIGLFSYRSSFYEVRGRMRIGDRVLEQKALVHRNNNQRPYPTTVMVREDIALKDAGQ